MFPLIFLNITIEKPRSQVAGYRLGAGGDHEAHMAGSMSGEVGPFAR